MPLEEVSGSTDPFAIGPAPVERGRVSGKRTGAGSETRAGEVSSLSVPRISAGCFGTAAPGRRDWAYPRVAGVSTAPRPDATRMETAVKRTWHREEIQLMSPPFRNP